MKSKSKVDFKVLCETLDDSLTKVFPFSKYGLTRGELREMKKNPKLPAREALKFDRELAKSKNSASVTSKKYKEALAEIERLSVEREAILQLATPSVTHVIKPHKGSKNGEATCVLVASDFHVEERVTKESVNGMNEYSVEIARKRAMEFFQIGLHLRNLEARNTPVPNMVLCLLGDFITGHIHEENFSTCSLQPVDAAYEAKNILKSGIDFLLENSDLNLIIPCHAGNHARITKKSNSSETEMGNSLELFIYGFLAQEYAGNPRVKFLISRSYTSKLKIYDTTLRLHHGHRIRSMGGVGGLSIPANKYVFRANTAWSADYDVFGHHHQMQKAPRFICNGSLIGFNAYAQDSAFEYEVPSQTYFLINKRWKTIMDYRPILFSI